MDDLNAGLRQAPYYFAFDISGALLIEQQAPYSINVDNVFIDSLYSVWIKSAGV